MNINSLRLQRRALTRLKQAYDAYETAFVILADGLLDEHVWEHLVRAENRASLRQLELRLLQAQKQQPIPDVPRVRQETYYRLIQVSSHLSYLAGELSNAHRALAKIDAGKFERSDAHEPHSYEELEALHALFALSALQRGPEPSPQNGLSLGLSVPRTVSGASSPARDAGVDVGVPSGKRGAAKDGDNNNNNEDAELRPSVLMSTLDAHGPLRLDYAYLLERAGNVFAKQGATL